MHKHLAYVAQAVLPLAVMLCCATQALARSTTPTQVLHPNAPAGVYFGKAVAVSGDTLFVGAIADSVGPNQAQGTVRVFRRTEGATWTFEATLTASDGQAFDLFGSSIAGDGDTVVIGTSRGNNLPDTVYVFVRAGGTWTQQAILAAPDAKPYDRFGSHGLDIMGDTVLVGADEDDVGANLLQGSAYVFVRTGSTWTQQAHLTMPAGEPFDKFGHAVSLGSEVAVIGAPGDSGNAGKDQGSAHVFTRSGSTWTHRTMITAPDGSEGDWFGSSIALSGSTIAIGAFGDDVGSNVNQGSVYVFTGSGAAWTAQDHIISPDGAPFEFFGLDVALENDTLLASSSSETAPRWVNVYCRVGSLWNEVTRLFAPDGEAADAFGDALAISADTIAIGALVDDVGANEDQGSVWVFSRVCDTWVLPGQTEIASDGSTNDAFGSSVAISGDTAIIGAEGDTVTAVRQGSAYVLVRAEDGWTEEAKFIANVASPDDHFGVSVAVSGDTAVVGAHFDDVAFFNQGSAYVFVRSGGTWSQQAHLTASDAQAGDQFGSAVAISGNTIVVGAPYDDHASVSQSGSAYIFVRAGSTWTQQAKLVLANPGASEYAGLSVDIDGDTVVIGSSNRDVAGIADIGAAYVYQRTGSNWIQQAELVASPDVPDDAFGTSVAISGDSVLVGAYADEDKAGIRLGAAYAFTRNGTTWTQEARLTPPEVDEETTFGHAIDFDGDTAVFGRAGFSTDAFIFTRTGAVWTLRATIAPPDIDREDQFGWDVAIDGVTALVGSPLYDVGPMTNQGSATSFDTDYGCNTPPPELVTVPTVEISQLAHSFSALGPPFGNVARDGVTFPSGPGVFTGPGFTASIGQGDEVVTRFQAPLGSRFALRIPPMSASTGFSVNARWLTGVSDAGSSFVQGTATWIGLVGPAPTETFAQDGMFNAGEAFKVNHTWSVTAPFEFEALEIRFPVAIPLLDVSRTYGTVNSTSAPSFVAFASGASMPDSVVMEIVTPPPPCPGDANGDNIANSADLSVLLAQFGSSVTPGTGADFNDDGLVNAADLSVLLANFGETC